MNERCPKCGSQPLHCSESLVEYECGSVFTVDGELVNTQWVDCRIAELESQLVAVTAERDKMKAALETVAAWDGFPSTGRTWDDGSPMSYSACYGSSGAREFMRNVAQEAITGERPHWEAIDAAMQSDTEDK